jgi:hypothetical protein
MSFEIKFRRDKDPKIYRADVEIVASSENLLKVIVKAGDKELHMDKYLFRKTNQWKIARTNFSFSGDSKRNALLILAIQDEIDRALVKTKKTV